MLDILVPHCIKNDLRQLNKLQRKLWQEYSALFGLIEISLSLTVHHSNNNQRYVSLGKKHHIQYRQIHIGTGNLSYRK